MACLECARLARGARRALALPRPTVPERALDVAVLRLASGRLGLWRDRHPLGADRPDASRILEGAAPRRLATDSLSAVGDVRIRARLRGVDAQSANALTSLPSRPAATNLGARQFVAAAPACWGGPRECSR